jgi:hypothetical protein
VATTAETRIARGKPLGSCLTQGAQQGVKLRVACGRVPRHVAPVSQRTGTMRRETPALATANSQHARDCPLRARADRGGELFRRADATSPVDTGPPPS